MPPELLWPGSGTDKGHTDAQLNNQPPCRPAQDRGRLSPVSTLRPDLGRQPAAAEATAATGGHCWPALPELARCCCGSWASIVWELPETPDRCFVGVKGQGAGSFQKRSWGPSGLQADLRGAVGQEDTRGLHTPSGCTCWARPPDLPLRPPDTPEPPAVLRPCPRGPCSGGEGQRDPHPLTSPGIECKSQGLVHGAGWPAGSPHCLLGGGPEA